MVVSLQWILIESKTQVEAAKALWSTSFEELWHDYAVHLDLSLHISKWYTIINPGGLFRNLDPTDGSRSVPPSYSEIMKRKEKKKILSFHFIVAAE